MFWAKQETSYSFYNLPTNKISKEYFQLFIITYEKRAIFFPVQYNVDKTEILWEISIIMLLYEKVKKLFIVIFSSLLLCLKLKMALYYVRSYISVKTPWNGIILNLVEFKN